MAGVLNSEKRRKRGSIAVPPPRPSLGVLSRRKAAQRRHDMTNSHTETQPGGLSDTGQSMSHNTEQDDRSDHKKSSWLASYVRPILRGFREKLRRNSSGRSHPGEGSRVDEDLEGQVHSGGGRNNDGPEGNGEDHARGLHQEEKDLAQARTSVGEVRVSQPEDLLKSQIGRRATTLEQGNKETGGAILPPPTEREESGVEQKKPSTSKHELIVQTQIPPPDPQPVDHSEQQSGPPTMLPPAAPKPKDWAQPPRENLNDHLIRGYLVSGEVGKVRFQPRRTLHQYSYSHLENVTKRDDDQVVYKYTCQPDDKEAKLFMVDQLCLWILGESKNIDANPKTR
jgi:hypothetical protein